MGTGGWRRDVIISFQITFLLDLKKYVNISRCLIIILQLGLQLYLYSSRGILFILSADGSDLHHARLHVDLHHYHRHNQTQFGYFLFCSVGRRKATNLQERHQFFHVQLKALLVRESVRGLHRFATLVKFKHNFTKWLRAIGRCFIIILGGLQTQSKTSYTSL